MRTELYTDFIQVQTRLSRLHPQYISVFVTLLFSLHLLAPAKGHGQDALSEYQVKAAYLFNFLKFVEWPIESFADPLAPIVIGVDGDNPFGNALPPVIRVDVGLSSNPIRGFTFSVWGRNLQANRRQEAAAFILPAGEIRRSVTFKVIWESQEGVRKAAP